ncbi:MAG: VOC family protein [Candidatus Melainabacteria bacterium]
MTVQAIPEGYTSLTPYMTVRDGKAAIEFYKKAFGAVANGVLETPDGAVAHADLTIGDAHFMLGSENVEMGMKSPQTLGGSPAGVMIYCEDVDALFQQAMDAGATSILQPTDMFWGDRYGKLLDPFGHQWSIGTHIKDVSMEDMKKGMMASCCAGQKEPATV